MAMLRFFRMPKHQQYEYKPRYWDPKKEELQERLKRAEDRKGNSAEAVKSRIAGGFKRGYASDMRLRKKQVMRSNAILLGIIVALVLLSILFLTVYLPKIVETIDSSGGQI